MARQIRTKRARTVDEVVALLHSDQEDDRAVGILDPAVPPVEVLALAFRPGNGYRVRAALALCGALPADMRRQILRDEYDAETRKHAVPGFFFLELEELGVELNRRPNLDEDTRAAIAAARTMFTRWERDTDGYLRSSGGGGWAIAGAAVIGILASVVLAYLAVHGLSSGGFLPRELMK
ncbi:hypothetical protein [Curtobacterium flaccumfaciens]|uniref:hypothetical protein n=1 Tax=Curtobacterium flaccumfaciens TaxID=2035 RepID=UPI001BDEDFD8|nr:hypothetical protein [Curtobacterium flaccumfaciens]MBT1633263.1 hypothetical protein [Curtobacterium flaccumfaciens pv. oortii]MCX2846910.1 hypothetical protein [Curtobacterium flaccumfaciens pv. oortii]